VGLDTVVRSGTPRCPEPLPRQGSLALRVDADDWAYGEHGAQDWVQVPSLLLLLDRVHRRAVPDLCNVHQSVDDVSGEHRGRVVRKAVGEHHGVGGAADEEVRGVRERAVEAGRRLSREGIRVLRTRLGGALGRK